MVHWRQKSLIQWWLTLVPVGAPRLRKQAFPIRLPPGWGIVPSTDPGPDRQIIEKGNSATNHFPCLVLGTMLYFPLADQPSLEWLNRRCLQRCTQ